MTSQGVESAASMVSQVQTMYSLPATYHRLTEAVENPDNSIAEIAEVISNDQSVAMRVLQLANSAFFSFPSKIETISHSLTLIGVQQVKQLIQGTAVIEMFEGMPSNYVTMRSFWEHSVACGLTAKILASLRQEPNVERFFVLGLLHDVGRLVLFQHAVDKAVEIFEEAQSTREYLYVIERNKLGFDHAELSSALMEHWHFPVRLAKGVSCHHRFSTSDPFALESATVHIADSIVHVLGLGGSGEVLNPPPDSQAWKELGLEPSTLRPLAKQLERQLSEVLGIIIPNT